MNVFDFITEDEIDGLPEEPRLAFVTFIRHSQKRLIEHLGRLDENDSYSLTTEAQHGFMNVAIAAAKRYGIEPFASTAVPRLSNMHEEMYRQFKADSDHYMTQLLLDNSSRSRRDSVYIEAKAKDRIRGHLHALKKCVEDASLPDAKKSSLFDKLADFESELDKRRLSLLAVARVTVEILAIPGALWASAEIAQKLITNVIHTVGESRAAEDEAQRLPSIIPPGALSAPRSDNAEEKPASPVRRGGADLDDEIPF